MSDRVMQPVNDANKKRKQTPKPYQSIWFAHWKQTSCDAAAGETTSHKEHDCVTRDDDLRNDLEDPSRSFSGLNMVKTTTFDVGDDVINISSKRIGNKRMLGSMFKDGQGTDEPSRMEFVHNLERGRAVDSRSGVQLHLLIPGIASADVIPSPGCRSAGEGTSYNLPKWMRTHSTGKDSIIGLNPLQETPVESSSRIVPYGFNFGKHVLDKGKAAVSVASRQSRTDLLKLQNGVHDVETMRICTTMDALGGLPEGCRRSSQTTKQTDVHMFTNNDIFRNTRVITKLNGNISSEFHCLSPFPGQGKNRVILQPLNGFIDSEVKEKKKTNVKASKVTIRNESSSQTDTMDMNSFEENSKKNLHYDSNPTTSNKANNLESYIPPLTRVASSSDVAHGLLKNQPLQINLELPALPCAATSSENTGLSFPKTLEMGKLLEHPKPMSNFDLNDFPNADPGNRWVKRLKRNSSNSFAQGTKSSNFSSSPSQEETSKLLKFSKSGTAISAPKSLSQSDKNVDFSKKDEARLTENPEDKCNALLLSHDWIKRWLHNGHSSKLSMEKLPSIAAMALMAKVLTSFQPCEFRKMGPLTVWNTKTF